MESGANDISGSQILAAIRECLTDAGIKSQMVNPGRDSQFIKVSVADGDERTALRNIVVEFDYEWHGQILVVGFDRFVKSHEYNIDPASPNSLEEIVKRVKEIVGTGTTA